MPNVLDDNFFATLNQTIEEANKKQTLEIKKEIEKLRESLQEESKKRIELEGQYKTLKEKYTQLEKSLKKNNIIIFGLDNTEEKLVDYVVKTLNTYLSLSLDYKDIDDVFTIGKKPSAKPVIVKLVSYLKKKEILQNAFKLKDVNKHRTNKITIAEDLSPDQIKTQRILRRHLKEARARKILAYIKGDKIFINGDEYTAEELEQKVNLNEKEAEEQEENDEVVTILNSNSAPATPTPRDKKRSTTESDNQSGNSKITKIVTGAPTVQTRTSGRKQEEKNKKIGTPNETKAGTKRN